MAHQDPSIPKKPYQITFPTREDEVIYTQKLMANCATYDGSTDTLATWVKDTGASISHEGYPETDHPFIIHHLIIDEALGYYQAHVSIHLFMLKVHHPHLEDTQTGNDGGRRPFRAHRKTYYRRTTSSCENSLPREIDLTTLTLTKNKA